MDISIPVEKLRYAKFRFALPEGLKQPRAILVLTPGSNDDGRPMVEWEEWKKFSLREDLAMIGCFFQDKDPSAMEGYARASEESGGALLWAIREIQDQLKLPLEHIPLLLWGFSAGGQFNYEMNASFPERVGAFVVNKGGIYYTALCSTPARTNPGLFFIGSKDAKFRQEIVTGLVGLNGRAGSNWLLVTEDCAHEIHQSVELSKRFFTKVLAGD